MAAKVEKVAILGNYRGPGTYTAAEGDSSTVISLSVPTGINTPGVPTTTKQWNSNGGDIKVTINSDEKSGTLDATLIKSSGSGPVHVSGNWMC
jgi:hypothetical protein